MFGCQMAETQCIGERTDGSKLPSPRTESKFEGRVRTTDRSVVDMDGYCVSLMVPFRPPRDERGSRTNDE